MVVDKAVDKIIGDYIKAHPGSQKLHEKAVKIFAANGATHATRIFEPFRPYITHAKGSRKWDVDGNEYIDYVLGHGALILGHGHPDVLKAVQEQVVKGTHYGENHELEIEWATLIQSMMPVMKRVEFFACGQEANMMGIRCARAFTGRKKIIRFVENFHGWADELLGPKPIGFVADQVKVLPMHDLEGLEAELATKEYAILFVEGGGAHMAGQVPWDTDFVRALPGLCQKYGTIFLIDEVVTGFREAPEGWQGTIGVTPDLTTLGKTIGGGLSVGALGPGMLTRSPLPLVLPPASSMSGVRFIKKLANSALTFGKKVTRSSRNGVSMVVSTAGPLPTSILGRSIMSHPTILCHQLRMLPG